MFVSNFVSIALLVVCAASAGLARAQEPAYGMLFQPKPAAVSSVLQNEPPLTLKSRPLNQADIDDAAFNTKRPSTMPRTPTALDLARMPLPSLPSATPASFAQQQGERMAAWEAQEEKRIEYERQVRLEQEAESRKQVIVVQQQQDPILSGLMIIPRAISYLFGGRFLR